MRAMKTAGTNPCRTALLALLCALPLLVFVALFSKAGVGTMFIAFTLQNALLGWYAATACCALLLAGYMLDFS